MSWDADEGNFEATSRFASDRGSFTWKIENFSLSSDKADSFICSPSFIFSGEKWHLEMFPNGETKYNTIGYIALRLVRDSSNMSEKRVLFKMGRKNEFSVNCLKKEFDINFGNEVKSGKVSYLIKRSALLDAMKDGYLPDDDTLTVFCELQDSKRFIEGFAVPTSEGRPTCADSIKSGSSVVCLDTLSDDFAALYGSSKGSDIVFKVEDKEIRAHKAILIARSQVFAAMFVHDTAEHRSKEIHIADSKASIINDMLWYMYTGKVENMNHEKAIGLFVASDKYALDRLKKECGNFFLASLSVNNICDIAVLADTHSDEKLMDSVKHFLRENITVVAETMEWKELLRDYPRLGLDLFQSITLNPSSKSQTNKGKQ